MLAIMLTGTSLSAIRVLIHIARNGNGKALSPRRIAEALGESPSYLSKVSRSLVKAGILRAEMGAKGGVRLGRPPSRITLLAIVEACQGAIAGDFCPGDHAPERTCSYHRAATELRRAIVKVLSRWSLAHLMNQPRPAGAGRGAPVCVMLGGERVGPIPLGAGKPA